VSTTSESLAELTTHEQPSPAPQRGFTLGPLAYNDYRLLFAGQLISLIGDAFYAIALPWYMLTQGGGAANLGLALTAYGVPLGAATLLGGWLSDKLRARRVMLFSDCIRAFILAGLAWLTFGGGAPLLPAGHAAPLWAIGGFTATLGIFDGLFMPASQAVTPDLIPDDQLQTANGLYYALGRIAQLVGPSLAGAAVSQFGSPISFAIDAATFVISTVTLVFIRGRARTRQKIAAIGASEVNAADSSTIDAATASETGADGDASLTFWRFAVTSGYFFMLMVVMIVANLFGGVAEVAYPALAKGPLHTDAQGYGFMIAASGAGGLVGGLLAGPLSRLLNRGWKSLLVSLIQVGPIIVLSQAPNVYVAIGCMAAFGVFNGLGNVSAITLIQRKLPRHLMGRIFGVISFCNFATLPISVAATGFAIVYFGPRDIIIAAGAILCAGLLLAFCNRELRQL
jgi:MFS family permease